MPVDPTATDDELTDRFAAAVALVKFDAELGFLCGSSELDVLHSLAVAMACHSPHGQRWESGGFVVWQIIERQRAGQLPIEPELCAEFFAWRAIMPMRQPEGRPPLVSAHREWTPQEIATLPTCRDCREPVIDPHPGCQPV